MKVVNAKQGSEEWFCARAGRVTASSVADAIAFLKRGDRKGLETASRAAYKARIVAETLRGEPMMDGYLSPYMEHGTATEPFARAAYEVKFKADVDTVGFVLHPSIDRAGASPDGLVGGDGLIEIKCPKTETHIDYIIAGCLPPEYEPQVMFQLACTERAWCDFVSFDPRMPSRHQVFCTRVHRDEQRIAEIESGVRQFLAEVDELITKLDQINPQIEKPKPAPEDFGEQGITDEDVAWLESRFMEASQA